MHETLMSEVEALRQSPVSQEQECEAIGAQTDFITHHEKEEKPLTFCNFYELVHNFNIKQKTGLR